MTPPSITAFILTRDEAQHIERCINSLHGLVARIVVVDSGSTDATREIAARLGADVFQHAWSNHSRQINWGLANTGIDTEWTFRLDADEVVLPGLAIGLGNLATLPAAVAGCTVNRRIHFLGRWIRHGGLYPVRTLRLWRTAHGRCEDRWMDEQILVDGDVSHIDADIADINLHNLGWWTAKHNDYATREAIEQLLAESDNGTRHSTVGAANMDPSARARRAAKLRLYRLLPFGVRAPLIFVYRYLFRLGVLDGWQGLVYYGLQAGWFRFLVDVKMRELKGLMVERNQSLNAVVETEYGMRLTVTPHAAGPATV